MPDAAYIPPGWTSHWTATSKDERTNGYYDYHMTINGTLISYGHADKDDSTDAFAGFADDLHLYDPCRQLRLDFSVRAPHFPHHPRRDATPAAALPGTAPTIHPACNEDISQAQFIHRNDPVEPDDPGLRRTRSHRSVPGRWWLWTRPSPASSMPCRIPGDSRTRCSRSPCR